jgi:hypothetical protein
MDDLNIGVIVLLQELQVESISDLSLQNRLDLSQPLLGLCLALFTSFNFSFDYLRNLTLIRLVFLITDIEGDLVSVKICVLLCAFGKFLE